MTTSTFLSPELLIPVKFWISIFNCLLKVSTWLSKNSLSLTCTQQNSLFLSKNLLPQSSTCEQMNLSHHHISSSDSWCPYNEFFTQHLGWVNFLKFKSNNATSLFKTFVHSNTLKKIQTFFHGLLLLGCSDFLFYHTFHCTLFSNLLIAPWKKQAHSWLRAFVFAISLLGTLFYHLLMALCYTSFRCPWEGLSSLSKLAPCLLPLSLPWLLLYFIFFIEVITIWYHIFASLFKYHLTCQNGSFMNAGILFALSIAVSSVHRRVITNEWELNTYLLNKQID